MPEFADSLPISPDIEAILGTHGRLAAHFPGFKAREGQLQMASTVLDALQQKTVLIAEAGTGTGKTFAYLVPAFLHAGKTIISTGTKTLQDQLFTRDLPVVREALGVSISVALLKGRANYVCQYHLSRVGLEGRLQSREEVQYLKAIERFATRTRTGDKAELDAVPESAAIWAQVTSTRENCLNQDCPFHEECFVLAARKRALSADLVVVNHHLFFADLMLKDEGAGELLPQSDAVIFDEAHLIPEIASLFLGETLATSAWLDLSRECRIEGRTLSAVPREFEDSLDLLEKSVRDLRLVFPEKEGRWSARLLSERAHWASSFRTVLDASAALIAILEALQERSETLKKLTERAIESRTAWARWEEERQRTTSLIPWIELFQSGLHLNSTPLSVAEAFRSIVDASPKAWVMTSATLSVAGSFTHFKTLLGLDDAANYRWESPFDYANNALLYVPEGLPVPNTPEYTRAVVEALMPVVRASQGRAFLLFTSHRALREAAELIRAKLPQERLPFELFVQGEQARAELLNAFRRARYPILLGSQSFWEGVDVKGDQLSVVVIDKLPFSAPDDPVLKARLDAIEAEGGQGFMSYQVPQAAVNLKQGAGRLIRDETDRGVLMICDPRLISKAYGKRLWRSLPPMRRTRDLQQVETFFATLPATAEAPPF
jgi:ATP-dependent DNA helicase DinG